MYLNVLSKGSSENHILSLNKSRVLDVKETMDDSARYVCNGLQLMARHKAQQRKNPQCGCTAVMPACVLWCESSRIRTMNLVSFSPILKIEYSLHIGEGTAGS